MEWEALAAISLAVLTLVVLGMSAYAFTVMRDVRRSVESLQRVLDALDRDGRPALLAARSAVEEAGKTIASVRAEVDHIVGASQELRSQVRNAAGALDDRVRDLEIVLDILQEEFEATVLDVAAVLRTTRRGASMARALKRVFLGGGRRR